MNRASYLYSDKPLSGVIHQHHYLLLFAWKLKQGLINRTNPGILRNYIEYFFHQSLFNHLKKEEEILFNRLSEEDIYRKKLEYGHDRIREKILSIISSNPINDELIETLCTTLISVVKYEENEFLPHIGAKLNGLESSWLNHEISELEEEFVDEFKPEFWENNN